MSATKEDPRKRVRSWKQDPEAVRADILRAAKSEFAKHGLAGTRVKDIADRIQTSRRMIFYYFGDKEGLYRAVLEEAYRSVRRAEAALNLDGLPPVEALTKLVEFTFDHHHNNADFIRLVMIENIHDAHFMKQIASLNQTNTTVIKQIDRILTAGIQEGLFKKNISPLELHWQISALSFFNVSNQATFSVNFGDTLFSKQAQSTLRQQVVDSILCLVSIGSCK